MTISFPPSPEHPLRLGARTSPLAVAQAELAAVALVRAHGFAADAIKIIPMTSTGDRIQDRALADVGGKALWTRELDAALDADIIDVAVHSLKDVETIRDPRFTLAAVLERADPGERLVVRDDWNATSIADLPQGARFGTSSPRRAAQVKRLRPDLVITLLRGNIATRLSRIAEDKVDATLLAAAGLDRVGMVGIGISQRIETLLPAASQGAIGIECRSDDARVLALLAGIDHELTHRAIAAERGFLEGLGGDCHSPVAAHARLRDGQLWLSAEIFSADGSDHIAEEACITDDGDAARLAHRMLTASPASIRTLFSSTG